VGAVAPDLVAVEGVAVAEGLAVGDGVGLGVAEGTGVGVAEGISTTLCELLPHPASMIPNAAGPAQASSAATIARP
jgi:hypothetical protein